MSCCDAIEKTPVASANTMVSIQAVRLSHSLLAMRYMKTAARAIIVAAEIFPSTCIVKSVGCDMKMLGIR